MVTGFREIVWTEQAIGQFGKAIKFIKKDSEQNAEKVRTKLLQKISTLSNPRIVHRTDPFKKHNDGSFLYFEFLRYRIASYSSSKSVVILRIRHTSMEPKKY